MSLQFIPYTYPCKVSDTRHSQNRLSKASSGTPNGPITEKNATQGRNVTGVDNTTIKEWITVTGLAGPDQVTSSRTDNTSNNEIDVKSGLENARITKSEKVDHHAERGKSLLRQRGNNLTNSQTFPNPVI
jgi:hypothetical protein